jgi:phage host-nuclease inhibitor protein Gam
MTQRERRPALLREFETMLKPSKSKTRGANVSAPQSREEASAFVRMIGEAQRAVARLEADMNDELARIKERAEAEAEPMRARIAAATEGLKVWCEANRRELTDGGKRKFADLGTGKIEWRYAPPKVNIRGLDAALAAIRTLGLPFLRVKEEIDKEAMLREPDKARLVPGVSIGSAGEMFSVEPFEAEIEGARS